MVVSLVVVDITCTQIVRRPVLGHPNGTMALVQPEVHVARNTVHEALVVYKDVQDVKSSNGIFSFSDHLKTDLFRLAYPS